MKEVWKDIDTHAKQWIREAGEQLMASLKKTLIIETKSNAADLEQIWTEKRSSF